MKAKNKNDKPLGMLPVYFFAVFFVFLIPLIHVKSTLDPVIYPRFTFLSAGLALLGLMLVFGKQKLKIDIGLFKSPFLLFLSAFILLTITSLFYAVNPVEGLTDLFKNIVFLFFVVFSVRVIEYDDKAVHVVLKAFVIVTSCALIVGFYQLSGLNFSQEDPNLLYDVKGLMAHKNQYSISLFLLLPFLVIASQNLARNWKVVSYVTIGLVLIMIFVIQTRSVWSALVISSFILSVLVGVFRHELNPFTSENKWITKLSLGIIGLILAGAILTLLAPGYFPFNKIALRAATLFDPDYASNQWRLEMWRASWNLFMDHLWFGVGAGNWKIEIYPYYSEFLPSVFKHWRNPHNDYLWVGSEKGVPGLVVYILMYGSLIFLGLKLLRNPESLKEMITVLSVLFGLSGFMVISFFSFPMERIYPLIFVGLYAALLLSLRRKKQPARITVLIPLQHVVIPVFILLYAATHFGVQCFITERNISKAQKAYEARDWSTLKHYADMGYSPFVPFEPKYSMPVIAYRGLAYFHYDKDYSRALFSFKKAHRQHPNQIMVINNIGAVYGHMGEYETSGEYYQKTLNIFPHYEYGLLNLAKAFFLQKEYGLAYQAILSCDPRSADSSVGALKKMIEDKLGP